MKRRCAQQLDRAGQRPALGEQVAVELAVPALDFLDVGVFEGPTQLAREGAGEEAAAHADPAMDAPALDRHPGLRQGALPGEDVGIDRVDEGSVEVEDQGAHDVKGSGSRSSVCQAASVAGSRVQVDMRPLPLISIPSRRSNG